MRRAAALFLLALALVLRTAAPAAMTAAAGEDRVLTAVLCNPLGEHVEVTLDIGPRDEGAPARGAPAPAHDCESCCLFGAPGLAALPLLLPEPAHGAAPAQWTIRDRIATPSPLRSYTARAPPAA